MAITLLTLKGNDEVSEVHVDVENYNDDTLVLKQYDEHPGGDSDWVVLTKPMLRELVEWARKEMV